MNLNSLNMVKNVLPQHSGKPTHSTNFPANMFLVGVGKKNCTAPFLDVQELHSPKTRKTNLCQCLYIPEYLRKAHLSDGGLNNFPQAAHKMF